jgi:hypothetical protein
MPVPERDETDRTAPSDEEQANEVDAEAVSERIEEALEPAFSEIGLRVAEAVTQKLQASRAGTAEGQPSEESDQHDETSSSTSGGSESEQTDPDEQEDQPEDENDPDSNDIGADAPEADSGRQSLIGRASKAFHDAFSDDGSADDDNEESDQGSKSSSEESDDDQSLLGQASGALFNSFSGSIRQEGGTQLQELVDQGVDMLFSRRGKGWVRRLADQTLQASLYDMLDTVDDPDDRYQLYRDNLSKLRPIVRNAVDAMYTEESRTTLKHQLHSAIPSLVHGDFNTAFSILVEALSDVTDHAEEEIWEHSTELLQVVQQISTRLLQEKIQDVAEEKLDPEEIQQKMQDKAEEARSTIQEKVGALQGSVQGAQEQLGGASGGLGGSGGSMRTGMPPQGRPPNGFPPFGKPPSGMPPSGRPPTGRPPNGLPPSGVHPAAKRRQQGTTAQTGRPRTRRTPER